MANSYIDPSLVRMTLPEGPGWEWNPGATFDTAFNNAQENKRANEKMAMEQQLSDILLPAKQAQANYEVVKLGYQTKLLEKLFNEQTKALPGAYNGVMSAVGSSSSTGQQSQPARAGIDWKAWGSTAQQSSGDDDSIMLE